jgi:hypothetical protein
MRATQVTFTQSAKEIANDNSRKCTGFNWVARIRGP